MLLIKILLQIAIGVAALLTNYLDYKWYDKRKTSFKKGRNVLIIITGLIICGSVFITIIDDNQNEKTDLAINNNLSSLKDSLSEIKINGLELSKQIEPFLLLAKQKYPNLPISEALMLIRNKIDSLEEVATILKGKEEKRSYTESQFEILKNTKPQIDAKIFINDKDEIIFNIRLLKNVPLRFKPDMSLSSNGYGLIVRIFTSLPEIYPKEGILNYNYKYGNLNELKYVQEVATKITMTVYYESIYANESKLNLRDEIKKEYMIDVKNKTLKPI